MLGGIGPCRFGYYAEVQKRILKNMGYDIDWITLDLSTGWINLLKNIKKLVGKNNIPHIINSLKVAWEKVLALDEIERISRKARPLEKKRGRVDDIIKETHYELEKAKTIRAVKEVMEEYKKKIGEIPKEQLDHLVKIGIVGEFYVVLDHFTNLELAKRLGEMGVWAENAFYIEDIVRIYIPLMKSKTLEERAKIAVPYIKRSVGGEGQRTIAHTIEFKKENFDGVIHLLPFTCMPEIVAEGVLERVSRDYDIPTLTLSIDEQTGIAGVNTRIEAFIDMLRSRKKWRLVD